MPSSTSLRVAVAGATGYIGMQCVEMLAGHPDVTLDRLLSRSHAGRRFSDVAPGSRVDLELQGGLDVDGADVVIAALPHTVAASQAQSWLRGGAVVVDMSADFRTRDAQSWERWYGVAHPAPDLCGEATYGLVELQREGLREADLIAVPGCYPTATLLALVPALRAGLVDARVIVDAKSGVSGAGRSPSQDHMFAEANESVKAYAVAGHRHKPEMLEHLTALAGGEPRLTFVPHLIPMTRGILVTAYMTPHPGVTAEQVRDVYALFAAANPFLRLDSSPPPTKSVLGSNVAALHVGWQDGVVVVTCAIDNLVKGAAGQGLQAMNVRFGLDEGAGLRRYASWP